MTLGERIYLYCERGTNEALWAEPINVISNAGFFLAALIFWQLLLWRRPEERGADHYLLIALTFAIGFGSLAFHLHADRGTALADIIPIAVFMLVYLGFALNRFLEVPPGWTVFLAIVFGGLVAASMQIHCWEGGIGFGAGAPGAAVCMNGSIGYLPALGALVIVAMLLAERGHRAAPYVLAATAVFAGSILLRSLDMSFCEEIVIEGRSVGTHFIWHLLNALVIFLLLRASLETETKPLPVGAVAPDEPEEKPEAKPEASSEVKPEPKPEPKPKPKAEPEPKSEPEPEPAEEAEEAADEKAEAPDSKEQSKVSKADQSGSSGDEETSSSAEDAPSSDDKAPKKKKS